MSVKPIELISMASKSWETSTQNMSRLQKQDSVNHTLAAQYGKNVEHDSHQTVKSAKSDQPEYRYNANERQGSNGFYQGGQGKKKDNKEEKEDTGNKSGHKLDILI